MTIEQIDTKAQQFVDRLHKLCDDVVAQPGDSFHDDAGNMIWMLYDWLFENQKINEDTTFSEVCNRINAIAPYVFTLDLEKCSETVRMRFLKFRDTELRVLEYHREMVLTMFQQVFDLTCAGALLGIEVYS